MNDNQEFEAREEAIPQRLGALIHSFLHELTTAEYENRRNYAQFIQAVIAMENAKWGVDVGILTMEQALSIMASVPIAELVNMDYLGVDEAKQTLEFRVSASRKSNDKLTAHAESQTNIGTGGLLSILGGGGSCSISAGTTYMKENRRASDYSSTVKTEITVKRMPPPETVSFLGQVTQEVVRAGMDINRQIIEKQKDQLTDDADSADVPKSIASGGSDDSDGGTQQQAPPDAGE